MTTVLVTGATGMVGRALVDSFVADPASLGEVCAGIDVVYHCAAVVADWGQLDEMTAVNVDGLSAVLASAVANNVERFILVSSLVVLGHDPQHAIDESAPVVETGDGYNATKIEAERVAIRAHRDHGLPLVILRPPYVYGPNDRQLLPRVLRLIESGRFAFVGDGTNPITLCYVGNLVDALRRAAIGPRADARIYHIADADPLTRSELVQAICGELGYPEPTQRIPVFVARPLTAAMEAWGRFRRSQESPLLNRFRLKFLLTPSTFSIERGRSELGYGPPHDVRDALPSTLRWHRAVREQARPGT